VGAKRGTIVAVICDMKAVVIRVLSDSAKFAPRDIAIGSLEMYEYLGKSLNTIKRPRTIPTEGNQSPRVTGSQPVFQTYQAVTTRLSPIVNPMKEFSAHDLKGLGLP
jgi:hypothetical protein